MSDPILMARVRKCPKCGGMQKVDDIRILGQMRRMWICQDVNCGRLDSTYGRKDEGEA